MPEEIPEIKLDQTSTQSMPDKRRFQLSKRTTGILGVVGIVAIILTAVVIIGVVLPLRSFISSAQTTYADSKDVYAALKNQDIEGAQASLTKTQQDLSQTKKNYSSLLWTKSLPYFGAYTSDGEHLLNASQYGLEAGDILIKAIVPYVDILGLKGKGTFAGGTTEDRIAKAVETLGKVSPELDKVAQKLDLIKTEVDPVDPNRYPETFQGKEIRSKIVEIKGLIDSADVFLSEARPMAKKLPDILGANGERKYMVLFQNDGELRPTGGFITAYAIFRIENGKIHLNTSDDIYKLDDTITKHITPPSPISTYLNVYTWRLRDSNFSPDYLSSMKTFEDLYNSSTAKSDYDGIIAMDTHVLLEIMDAIGPVNIYGTDFTTKKVDICDCAMVIYELEKYADEPKSYERGSRKDIIGVLLSEIMHKTLSAPKQLLGKLAPVLLNEIATKHVLVYMHDPDAQAGVETLGWAGRIKVVPGNVDYLHINDANLGGAKSNLYIKEKVTLLVQPGSDKSTNNLTIEYQHPRPADNCSLERKAGLCLSGIYRDYVRVYLPKGSTLVESRGFENHSTTFEDLDHTVVDGFFTVVPLGLAKIQIKYTTPIKSGDKYQIMIQKQPGTDAIPYKITVNDKQKQITLDQDQVVEIP